MKMKLVTTIPAFTLVFGLMQWLLWSLLFESFIFQAILVLCLCPGATLFGPGWQRFFAGALTVLAWPTSFLGSSDPSGGNAGEFLALLAANSVIWGTVVGFAFSVALELAQRSRKRQGPG